MLSVDNGLVAGIVARNRDWNSVKSLAMNVRPPTCWTFFMKPSCSGEVRSLPIFTSTARRRPVGGRTARMSLTPFFGAVLKDWDLVSNMPVDEALQEKIP